MQSGDDLNYFRGGSFAADLPDPNPCLRHHPGLDEKAWARFSTEMEDRSTGCTLRQMCGRLSTRTAYAGRISNARKLPNLYRGT